MEGRSWEQTILPRGRTNTHTQMSSVMQPVHGIPVLFMTVLYLWAQALCMCKCARESKAQLVSGNLCTDKHSNASIPCGKPTTCWSVKGESPGEQRKLQNFGSKFLFLLPIKEKKCILLTLPLKRRKKKHLVYYLLITLIFFILKRKKRKWILSLRVPFR